MLQKFDIDPRRTSMTIIDTQAHYTDCLPNGRAYVACVNQAAAIARKHGVQVTWVALDSECGRFFDPRDPCLMLFDPVHRGHHVHFEGKFRSQNLQKTYGHVFDFEGSDRRSTLSFSRQEARTRRHLLQERLKMQHLHIMPQDDIVVKCSDGVLSTQLLPALYESRNMDTIITFGLNTRYCVATSASQISRKFRCIVPCDLLADVSNGSTGNWSPEEHKLLLKDKLGPVIAQRLTFCETGSLFAALSKNPEYSLKTPPALRYGWSSATPLKKFAI